MALSKIFGIYSTSQKVEVAVDELLSSGFSANSIWVLHPDNQKTRDFAQRRGTRPPVGTVVGKTASVPLDGTRGILDPGAGPVAGALSSALAEMGVPAEWCDRQVVDEEMVLLSVECDRTEQVADVAELLKRTGAEKVDSAVGGTGDSHPPGSNTSVGGDQKAWPEIASRNL